MKSTCITAMVTWKKCMTAKALAPEHEAQILGYLKSSRLEHGLLINFGAYKFEIRKFVWTEGKRAAKNA